MIDTKSYPHGHSTACWRYQKPNYEPTEEWTEIRPLIPVDWCTVGICFIRIEFGHNEKVCPMLSAVSHEFTPTIAQAFGGEAYHAGYLRDAAEMYKHGILMMGREASQHCTFIHFDPRCQNQQRSGANSGRNCIWCWDSVAATREAFEKGTLACMHDSGSLSFTGPISMQ